MLTMASPEKPSKVYCAFKNDGCCWTGRYDALPFHVRSWPQQELKEIRQKLTEALAELHVSEAATTEAKEEVQQLRKLQKTQSQQLRKQQLHVEEATKTAEEATKTAIADRLVQREENISLVERCKEAGRLALLHIREKKELQDEMGRVSALYCESMQTFT
jgi:hypothetical protein